MAKFEQKRKVEKMFFRIKSATVRSEGIEFDFVRMNRKAVAFISSPKSKLTS